tara:strand:+ start:1404 stop:2096 length:693 start_codon:yes stop_codon:yes gene_type:complete
MKNKKNSKKQQLDAKQVESYLMENKNFFNAREQLISKFNLPHNKKGSISLIERQIEILREENKAQKDKLIEFIDTGAKNDKISKKILTLATSLISSKSQKNTFEICYNSFFNDFKIKYISFVIFKKLNFQKSDFVLQIDRQDKSLGLFQTFLKSKSPRCNLLTNQQYKLLFKESDKIRSSALIPLFVNSHYGFLAIGSDDEKRFNPDMSMDYLTLIGNIISLAIKRDHRI